MKVSLIAQLDTDMTEADFRHFRPILEHDLLSICRVWANRFHIIEVDHIGVAKGTLSEAFGIDGGPEVQP